MGTEATQAERLTYPISPEYVKNWTSERALAELIANAIDEDPSFRFEWEGGVLTIEDSARGIGDHGLMLGLSNKGSQQIGQWGEGLNIAMLVLARDKRVGRIRVETVGYSFEPLLVRQRLVSVGHAEGPAPQMLALDITASDKASGTLITIECPEALAAKARGRFLHFEEGYAPPPPHGRVIGTGAPGRVYIGGVLVAEKRRLIFSYDFSLDQAKSMQNRDRTVVDAQAQDRLIAQALSELTDVDLVERWARAGLADDLGQAEQCFPYSPLPEQKLAFAQARERVIGAKGEKVCHCFHGDEEALLDLKDRGYRVIERKMSGYCFDSLMKLMEVPSAGELVRKPPAEREERTEWIKDKDLTEDERANLKGAVAIIRAVFGPNAVGTVSAYERTWMEGTTGDMGWGGFYMPRGAGRIGIQREELSTLRQAVRVLGHEAAHRIRHRKASWEYQDRTRGFEQQLDGMLGQALMLLHEHGLIDALDARQKEKAACQERLEADYEREHPTALMRALIKERMAERGLESAADLARASGVTPHFARGFLKGRRRNSSWECPASTLVRSRAVARALDLDPSTLHLVMMCEAGLVPLGPGYAPVRWCMSRRASGKLKGAINGAKWKEATTCIDDLREQGVEASCLDVIAHHRDNEVNTQGEWSAPYLALIERERQAAVAAS
jgi:hypothetical protein